MILLKRSNQECYKTKHNNKTGHTSRRMSFGSFDVTSKPGVMLLTFDVKKEDFLKISVFCQNSITCYSSQERFHLEILVFLKSALFLLSIGTKFVYFKKIDKKCYKILGRYVFFSISQKLPNFGGIGKKSELSF